MDVALYQINILLLLLLFKGHSLVTLDNVHVCVLMLFRSQCSGNFDQLHVVYFNTIVTVHNNL